MHTTNAPGRVRWAVSIAAILGAVPYIALKVLWLSGSREGIEDPEFGKGSTMMVLNAATGLMDIVAVALALSFVMPWGRKVPAAVMLLPMWVATGLLGQILIVLPLQLATGTDMTGADSTGDERPTALAAWVPAMVYGGFAWQGLFLILGFALHVFDRWGSAVRLGSRLDGQSRAAAGAAEAAAVGAFAVASAGLLRLPGAQCLEITNIVGSGLIASGAGLGILALSTGRPVGLPRWIPVGLSWVGSGAMFAWGAYLTSMAVLPSDLRPEGGVDVTAVGFSTFQALVGAGCGVVLLRQWDVKRSRTQLL